MGIKTLLWKFLWPLRARRHKGLEVGSYFPDFTLKDVSGRKYSFSDNPDGKLTALWFTNLCEDCRKKIPLLEDLKRQSDGSYRILAVSILGAEETLPRQIAMSCSFPILLDPQDITSGRLGLPHSSGACPLFNFFIADPSGRILYRRHLSAMSSEEFYSVCEKLMALT